jgi:PAS domain S-box-containing protein
MQTQLRKTGIDTLGDIPWGTHFCQIYHTKKDLIDILVPYFRAGLENNEYCFWVTAPPLDETEAREAMKREIPDFERYLAEGQIDIVPHTRWYLRDGMFKPEAMLEAGIVKFNQVAEGRYDGVRGTGNASWVQDQDWDNFTCYEEMVSHAVEGQSVILLCTYPIDRCGVCESLDVARNHRLTLVRRKDQWQSIENLEYRKLLNTYENTELQYRHLFENTLDGIEVIDGETGRIVLANQAAARMFGFAATEEMVGLDPLEYIPREDRERVARMIAEDMFAKDLHEVIELRVMTNDGREVWVSAIGVRIEHQGKLAGLVSLREVTERRHVQQRLMDSEKRYRLLAENITDGIWTTDLDLRLTYVSPSVFRLRGYDVAAEIALPIDRILTPESLSRAMEVYREQLSMEAENVGDPSRSWTIELEAYRKNGSTMWVEEKVNFLRDADGRVIGLLGVTRDISERRKAEEELRASEEKYRTVVESSPDAILALDGAGNIIDCNESACQLLNCAKENLGGSSVLNLIPNVSPEVESDYNTWFSQAGVLEQEFELADRDGQVTPVWAKAVKLPGEKPGDVRGIVYLRDIAQRRKMDELKDEFIGLVSHEFRSPLTVVIGAINTALTEAPHLTPLEIRQLLEDAAMEAESLAHLLENLLELSRARANRLMLQVEPVSVKKVVHNAVARIQKQSTTHRFVVDLPGRFPMLAADQIRLERILHNLLENAVKYSPKGGEIRVFARRDKQDLVIGVRDCGIGLSAEDKARLFEPFQRIGHSNDTRIRGVGLGLLVCRRLVEAHRGRIWVESELGKGSTFLFTFPLGRHPLRRD